MEESKKYTLTINTKNLEKVIEKRKNNLDKEIEEFLTKYYKTKLDKMGNVINDTNPLLVSTYFFKSINPIGNVEPVYTSEQLALVYELYSELIERVNMEIMTLQPTISHFAKFIGMSLNKFQELKYSYDDSMRSLVERINADIFDANMTLAQHNKLKENTTKYRMKVENEMIEKKTPNINVNVNAKNLDLDKMQERLYEIENLTKKQIYYEGD